MSAGDYCIARIIGRAQGWFSDGWATKTVRFMFPPVRHMNIVIRGTLPPLSGLIPEQTIRVSIDNYRIATKTIGPGDFTIYVEVPAGFRAKVINLTVEASRSYIPALHGKWRDWRRLCYMLREIVLSDRFDLN